MNGPQAPGPTRDQMHRGSLVGGLFLVIVGSAFLIGRIVEVRLGADTWPLWVIAPGVAMIVAGLVIGGQGGVGLTIPGSVVATVGLILAVQDATGWWQTWAYAWALVIAAVGVGMLLHGLVHRDRELAGNGLRSTVVGLGLFVGFALFFEGALGLSGGRIPGMSEALPVLVVGLGVLLILLSVGRRSASET